MHNTLSHGLKTVGTPLCAGCLCFAQGDCIVIQLANCSMLPVSALSAIALGATAALCDERATTSDGMAVLKQLAAFYARVQPTGIVCSSSFLGMCFHGSIVLSCCDTRLWGLYMCVFVECVCLRERERLCLCMCVCVAGLVASGLSNAGLRAKIFITDSADSDADVTSSSVFVHPAILSVCPLATVFCGGVEGFPSKVRASQLDSSLLWMYLFDLCHRLSLPRMLILSLM